MRLSIVKKNLTKEFICLIIKKQKGAVAEIRTRIERVESLSVYH